jgi:hypothetical protein
MQAAWKTAVFSMGVGRAQGGKQDALRFVHNPRRPLNCFIVIERAGENAPECIGEGRRNRRFEMRMITMATAVVLLVAGAAQAQAGASSAPEASNGGTCLPTNYIVKTDVAPDEHSITFHMKDGKTWVNTLPVRCRGLNLHGFSYVGHTTLEVCGKQGIRLLQTGTVCMLGDFAPGPTLTPAPQY